MWPEAQIIHCTRLFLPTAWSLFKAATGKWYKPGSPAVWSNFARVWPEELQRLWREHYNDPLAWACIDSIVWEDLIRRDLEGTPVIEWPYEEFVYNPRQRMATLVQSLGLAPDVSLMSKVDGTSDCNGKYKKQASQEQLTRMYSVESEAKGILQHIRRST